ncbi:Rv3212 family protein [Actinokineospora pegani]|uniref:Rv3212 family protein n=1 Tax=Actinokineospora pegani TaxID=2654637 RepID=UPI0012EA0AE0|nr:hypothetical protein [Actinokineospora pegani]
MAAVGIVVALVAAGVLVWRGSEFAATSSPTSDDLAAAAAPPTTAPTALREVWRAAGAAPAVAAGDGGAVLGRDPLTGEPRWSYRRDVPLCAVAWAAAVAVFDNGGACSEVVALDGVTGARQAARNSDVGPQVHLVSGGGRLVAGGCSARGVRTWSRPPSTDSSRPPVNPDPGCAHESALTTPHTIVVLERRADEDGDRTTVLDATPDEPEVTTSRILPSDRARLVAADDQRVAVALPDPDRVTVLDARGIEVATHTVRFGPRSRATSLRGVFTWHNGETTTGLSTDDFRPLWTVRDALGPATALAGRVLVPTRTGYTVLAPAGWRVVDEIPVDRGGHGGPVLSATAGPMVLEQRGADLVALR